MKLLRNVLLVAAVAGGLNSAPALADRPRGQRPPQAVPVPREQERAWEATRDGRSMSLPQLERRVMPLMGGADYLGPELNGDNYRFKFMQNGRVIWVDVDGQGRIIRRSHDR
jgi:hypothetical protein